MAPLGNKNSPAAATPARSSRPNVISIREQKAIDTLINIGLLIDKKLDCSNKENPVFRYYDSRGEILLVKRLVNSNSIIQYEAYKVAKEDFVDDLNYDQLPKLFIATTTDKRIDIEHYIPGAWENRLAKLAEDKLDGKDKKLPKIRKHPRSPKKRPTD